MPAILEIKNLTKRFKGLTAVDRFSASLDTGGIYGLIGTNGAGKTTVINMISGVISPTAGEVFFNSKNIAGQRSDKVAREGIGRTFQNLRLFGKMTALENVLIGAQMHKTYGFAQALCITEAFTKNESQLADKAYEAMKIVGVDSYAGTIAGSLPYGIQRRLEIARALATQPSLLLLDEPAAGLNPYESAELVSMIRSIRDTLDVTVLLIEHDMKVVMGLCEYLYVMAFGEIIAKGFPEDIRNDSKVIHAYLGRSKRA